MRVREREKSESERIMGEDHGRERIDDRKRVFLHTWPLGLFSALL